MAKKSMSIGVDKETQARWDVDTLRQALEIQNNARRMKAAGDYIKKLGGVVSKSTPSRSSSRKK